MFTTNLFELFLYRDAHRNEVTNSRPTKKYSISTNRAFYDPCVTHKNICKNLKKSHNRHNIVKCIFFGIHAFLDNLLITMLYVSRRYNFMLLDEINVRPFVSRVFCSSDFSLRALK